MEPQEQPPQFTLAPLLFLLMLTLSMVIYKPLDSAAADWLMAGQNLYNTRHQPDERLISRGSVRAGLQVKWRIPLSGRIVATPAVQDEFLYVPDNGGNLYKIHTETGAIVWQNQIVTYTGIQGDSARGTPAITRNLLILGNQPPFIKTSPSQALGPAYVFAVNKDSGALSWKTVVDKIRSADVTQSAVVHEGLAYIGVASNQESLASKKGFTCCDFRGKLVALGLDHGAIKRYKYTTPDTSTGYSCCGLIKTSTVVSSRKSLKSLTHH